MHDKTGKPIMEWDGIFICCNKVFLCESKHKMTEEKITMLVKRLMVFSNKLEVTKDFEFKKLLGMERIGVACATFFPRVLSVNELGLVVAYPGGGRYCVEVPSKIYGCHKWCNYLLFVL
ncbi:hypothetical protein RhiirA4_358664 [Rhizophagus irregularis]|uniref:Uncharacterized protein n=1 Tax=Rhizophagus irregularis TaxID=588596 RepID=A0A2I1GL90_9GLOM|nr:hypothetical protein RhiirA4_358664 [Rhizophagus irregularis]